MQYKQFEDIELSRLGMGNMRLPGASWSGGKIKYDEAKQIIDYAMAHGINYYDTAWVYCGSEEFLGRALAEYDRDSYYLATKFYIGSTKDYEKVFETQLERLRTDHIDFYLIHNVNGNNVDKLLKSGCIDYFENQRDRGRIAYLGFSSHGTPEVQRRFLDAHEWDFGQIQLNYYDWLYGSAKAEYEQLAAAGIPIMVMESVRGGKLASLNPRAEEVLLRREPGRSIASWAFRWLMTLPGVQLMLSGMSSLEQIVDNVRTFDECRPLSDEETRLLFAACDLEKGDIAVPCTACRYCTGDCPMRINIPAYMGAYNMLETHGRRTAKSEIAAVETDGTPADCIGCRKCEEHCPQGIGISRIMKELAKIA